MPSRRVRLWATSKSGCFTCKSRHIKCDEGRPECLRCTRSGHKCEGYQQRTEHRPHQVDSLVNLSDVRFTPYPGQIPEANLSQTITSGYIQSEQQYRCIQLGLHLVSFDSFSQFKGAGQIVETLIPQLCFSNPSVCATVAATGAAYRLQALSSGASPVIEAFAVSQYQSALNALRQDLSQLPQGPLPIILTCLMLSLTEIFLQREDNALFHLAGAAKLLQYRRDGGSTLRPLQSDISVGDRAVFEDALDLLFRTADLQTSSYSLSQQPRIMPVPTSSIFVDFVDLDSAHEALIRLAHICYSFLNKSYELKHQQQIASASLHEEQNRLIALLRTWLERFERADPPMFVRHIAEASLSTRDCHALKLRMTALAALIQLCCITCPYETAYDVHDQHFRQIIADGEAVISVRSGELDQPAGWEGCQRFTAGPGIIQPLFMAAFKCRHPVERRRAIRLLALSGREGPWNGTREARITSRLMKYEEAGLEETLSAFVHGSVALATSQGEVSQGSSSGPAPVPEASRIHDMGFSPAPNSDGKSKKVIVRYRRCRDIQGSLRCEHRPDPGGMADSGFGGLCMEDMHWESWSEVLEF